MLHSFFLPILLAAGQPVLLAAAQPAGESPRSVLDQAISDFERGRITESVAGFDRVVQLAPGVRPQLWQRGIALYYAGRYKDCREQFEEHRTVNPDDVENAAWHYLCVARQENPAAARKALLPVGEDPRPPMKQIYEMFRGDIPVEKMLAAAGPTPAGRFYAELYAGLFLEAQGNTKESLAHMRRAAAPEYAVGGYMHMVAQVHLRLRP